MLSDLLISRASLSLHHDSRANSGRPWSLAYRTLRRCLIPTVFAASLPNDQETGADAAATQSSCIESLKSCHTTVLVSDDEVNEYIAKETGRDRVLSMFSRNSVGELSPELNYVGQVVQSCSFMFFLVTSVAGATAARERFIEKNKSTKFNTRFIALRSYNDAVFFGALRYGIKWGLKSAIFAGLFMISAQTVSVYRNKTGVVEYVCGGGLTCALFRMHMGLRGMFAAGVIGSGLGLAAGSLMCALLHATDDTQQQRHFKQLHQIFTEKRETELLSPKIVTIESTASSDTQQQTS